MKIQKDLMMIVKKMGLKSTQERLLFVVIISYIMMDVKTPSMLGKKINTSIGKVVVLLMSLLVSINVSSVNGVLLLIAGYMLIKRSTQNVTHSNNGLPTEKEKWEKFEKYNSFPVTLEEQMVEKLAPLVKETQGEHATYVPVLGDLHDAAKPDYSGVN
tara:strand:- start:9437 stop:9910 length:474 start_codon:yes stop_codon:yes gene_type:complete